MTKTWAISLSTGEEIDFAVDIRFRPRLENGAVFYFTLLERKNALRHIEDV